MSIKKGSEIVFNVVLLIIGIALWSSAQTIEVGAAMGKGGGFLPKLCTTLWVIISGLMLGMGCVNKTSEGYKEGNVKGFFATLILLFIYVLMLKPIGFVITSIIYMFTQMMLFVPKTLIDKRRLIWFAIISILLPILVDLLFANVFSLILPAGILK